MKDLLQIGDLTVFVQRKPIKNLYLRIKAPDGQIFVTAPLRVSRMQIERLVTDRRDWILARRSGLRRPWHVPESLADGSMVYLWGRPLTVGGAPAEKGVAIDGERLLFGGTADRYKALKEFYRTQVSHALPAVAARRQTQTGITAAQWRVRDMKSRWGSCNIDRRRIWISLNLAACPPECLEYIVVHELCHLLERGHNQVFYGHVTRFLPDWKLLRERLKGAEVNGYG